MTTLQFVRREQWATDVWEYFFEPEIPLTYTPGQYANFTLANVIDARGSARTFTMTSLPTDALLSFAVKISNDPSPYKIRLGALKQSDIISMGEPMGDLVMPRSANTPLLFVAGGLGVASYISLLRLRSSNPTISNPVSVLWALRSQSDRYKLPALDTITSTDLHIFTAPNRLNLDDIMQQSKNDTLIYLSGSEHFVSGLRNDLHIHGITDARILFDYFSGYKEL